MRNTSGSGHTSWPGLAWLGRLAPSREYQFAVNLKQPSPSLPRASRRVNSRPVAGCRDIFEIRCKCGDNWSRDNHSLLNNNWSSMPTSTRGDGTLQRQPTIGENSNSTIVASHWADCSGQMPSRAVINIIATYPFFVVESQSN